jgi:hypothetical protein
MRQSAAARIDCPVATPSHTSVYARTLHRACVIVGGVEHLASQFGISAVSLVAWMEGREVPPLGVFLGAVDVILLNDESAGKA